MVTGAIADLMNLRLHLRARNITKGILRPQSATRFSLNCATRRDKVWKVDLGALSYPRTKTLAFLQVWRATRGSTAGLPNPHAPIVSMLPTKGTRTVADR